MIEIRKPTCIACSALKHELKALVESGEFDFPIESLDSMLHMTPQLLHQRLDAAIDGHTPALLVYGDCHPHMHETAALDGVTRLPGINCAAILLSNERFRELNRQRAYLLLPEWTQKWQDILLNIPGFNEKVTRDMMRDCFDKFVYLDTGVIPLPTDQLDACSSFFGLPWQRESVSLHLFKDRIRQSLDRLAQPR